MVSYTNHFIIIIIIINTIVIIIININIIIVVMVYLPLEEAAKILPLLSLITS